MKKSGIGGGTLQWVDGGSNTNDDEHIKLEFTTTKVSTKWVQEDKLVKL